MAEFRMTRPDVYKPGTPGHTNKSARQGHYIKAQTPQEAWNEMKKKYPTDTRFDIQLWRDNDGYLVRQSQYQ